MKRKIGKKGNLRRTSIRLLLVTLLCAAMICGILPNHASKASVSDGSETTEALQIQSLPAVSEQQTKLQLKQSKLSVSDDRILAKRDSQYSYRWGVSPEEGGDIAEFWNKDTKVLTLMANPNPGYIFIAWTEEYYDSESGMYKEKLFEGGDPYSTVISWTVQPYVSRVVIANFKKLGEYDIYDASKYSPKGELKIVSPANKSSYKAGETITIKAVPNPGYKVLGLQMGLNPESGLSADVEWEDLTTGDTASFVMPASDVWVYAIFASTTPHTVKLFSNGHGTVTFEDGSTSKQFVAGDKVQLVITPDDRYCMSLISGVTSDYDFATKTFTMADQDLDITCSFKEAAYYEMLLEKNHNWGQVEYDLNQDTRVVTLTTTPLYEEQGGFFDGYYEVINPDSDNPEYRLLSKDLVYSFVLTRNIKIQIRFVQGYQVAKAVVQHGSISRYPEKKFVIPGETVKLLATPDEGYVLDYFLTGEYKTDGSTTVDRIPGDTFVMPNYTVVYMAVFARAYTITAASNDTTLGAVAGGGQYKTGTEVKLTAMPKEGYEFVNWTENGSVVSTSSEYTFTASADRSLVANFREIHKCTLTRTPAKAATCTTAGNTEYWTCSGCGKYYSDANAEHEITLASTVIPALGHSMKKTEAKSATCTEAGNIAYWTCSNCKKIFSDVNGNTEITAADTVIAALGHSLKKTEAKAATCTTAGNIEYWKCERCGKYFSDQNGNNEIAENDTVIAATGHSLTKTAAKDPTCTETGNIEYWTCSNCEKCFADENGENEIPLSSVTIPAEGHHFTKTTAKAATCTEAGNIAYWTCSVCKKIYSDASGNTEITAAETVVAALGHAMTKTAAKAATCTENGNTEYWTCSNCKKIFSDANGENEIAAADTVIAALGHSMKKTAAKAATCTTAGNIEYWTCSTCGKIYSDANGTNEITAAQTVIAALGHSMTKTAAKAATCTTTGNIEYWTCSTCGKIYSDANGTNEITAAQTAIAALGHSMTKTAAKAATCTTAGNIAYWTCSTCGKIYSDANGTKEITKAQTVVNAKGHSLVRTPAKAPTSATDGNIEYWTCSICGKIFSDAAGKNEITLADTIVKANAPVISTQPKDVTVLAGNKATFTVAATGESALTYQWQAYSPSTKKWTNSSAPGAKTESLIITTVIGHNGFRFRCVITDAKGISTTSNEAKLTVNQPLTITAQPAGVTVQVGKTANFAVTAKGTGTLKYQWQAYNPSSKTWVNSGAASAKTATLSITTIAGHNGFKFRCVITDGTGKSITSNEAALTVTQPLTITAQPAAKKVALGETAAFSITAKGTGTLTYQWQAYNPGTKKWVNSSAASAKTANFSLKAQAAHNGFKFRCVVTDANGASVTSNEAALTVETPKLTISTQPVAKTIPVGGVASFSVAAEGAGALTYQWQAYNPHTKQWVKSSAASAKTANLSITALAVHNGFKFRCVITDAAGQTTTSKEVLLTVRPGIVTQPENQKVAVGETVTFTIEAQGSGTLTYQWQVWDAATSTWKNSAAASAKTAKFSFKTVAGHNGKKFRCIVSDAAGNKTNSKSVTLTVR